MSETPVNSVGGGVPDTLTPADAFAPLRRPVFRALWLASVVSNVGTWMQNVGAGWLMTSLSPSPTVAALVQAATTLPVFQLALPGGALADVLDRRRVLLVTSLGMAVVAAALGVCTLLDLVNATGLLVFTFLLGAGSALNSPAWQAITPEVVERSELPAAVTLGSAGFNVSRAVGPALGGLLVAAVGPGANFLLNAASFLAVLAVVFRWRREPVRSALPAERFLSAMRVGVRYVAHALELHAVFVRAVVFTVPATALWALLPVFARQTLGLGPLGYGLLLGALGVGAVAGTLLLPRLRRRWSVDGLVAAATVTFAAVSLAMASLTNAPLLGVVLLVGGGAWLTILTSLNGAAQLAIPAWVRARALAVYLLVFSGSMMLGSVLWGLAAGRFGIAWALNGSAVALVLGLLATRRFPLCGAEALDVMPAAHLPLPPCVRESVAANVPVLVTVEYHSEPGRAGAFKAALSALRRHRLRDGAIRWDLFQDAAQPGRYVETFLVESWTEHRRQHERATVSDRAVQDRARAFHLGPEPPAVTHLLLARVV